MNAQNAPPADTLAPAWPAQAGISVSDLGSTGLTLSWPAASDDVGVTQYRVLQDGTPITDLEATVQTHAVTGLRPGTSYNFTVMASDAAGNWSVDNPTATVTTTTEVPENPPDTAAPTWPADAQLTVSSLGMAFLTLHWPAASDNVAVTTYRIYQDSNLLATVSADNLSYAVTGLAPETGYMFTVQAGDAAGNWSASGPCASVLTPAPAIVRVSPSGNDNNTGESWALAKQTVQAGIEAAAVTGGEVWVQQGTYKGSFFLRAYVALRGGFDGTETQREQRDVKTHTTTLTGAGSSVVSFVNTGASCGIDGFTITGGDGTKKSIGTVYEYNFESHGGGIYCVNSSPVIANNIIIENRPNYLTARLIVQGYVYGAGVYCEASNATITNNLITQNFAYRSGGGIYGQDSSLTVTNNTISRNSTLRLDSLGGGGICATGGSLRLDNNTIDHNVTGTNGGGIFCNSSSAVITNNTISNNEVHSSGDNTGGAGIYCMSPSAVIANNTITKNFAHGAGSLYPANGGGIFYNSYSSTIANNTISGNTAYSGAGISCYYASSCVIINNTLTGNTALDNHSGGIYASGTSATIANNLITFNNSGISGDNNTCLHNNCVFNPGGDNYAGLPPGPADISQDPLFVDYAAGELHLTALSPCIDAGSDSDVQAGWLDMDGQGRIYGAHVDIGADEWYPP